MKNSTTFLSALAHFFQFQSGLRNRHLMIFDVASFCITPIFALWLRLDEMDLAHYAGTLIVYIAVATILRLVVFVPLGMYARYWRYASIDEALQIVLATASATFLVFVVYFVGLPLAGLAATDLPRSIPFIDGLLVLGLIGGARFSIRFADRLRQQDGRRQTQRTRVVVFGAGDAGTMIVREMRKNPQLGLDPVVFLDSDPRKQGMWIYGVLVEGNRDKLTEVVARYSIEQAIIAIPTASGKTIRELTRLCQDAHLPVKTVPGMFELLDGSVRVNQLRPVEIADLLRREPVETDLAEIAALLQDKRVLITGAGGSIGSELCRQVARCAPAEMILLGHGENSIFEILNELQSSLAVSSATTNYVPVIADVRDLPRLRAVFARHQPQIVFHAAAHKHVPLMEDNIEEAVTNNVLGARNMIDGVSNGEVEHFVLISTDKAVNPTSVMGATKRVAELLVQSAAGQTGKNLAVVRFGNVLDSRGSVVPLFKKQIAQGGPITITHPEIRRYFMTIPEAVQLVLQTAVLGTGGEIFILDMGEPIRIVDLARDLIRLSGLEDDEIEIKFTGLRPGEKLYEELVVAGEEYYRTPHEKIWVGRNGMNGGPASDGARARHSSQLAEQVDALIAAAAQGDSLEIRRLLRMIVPEFGLSESVASSEFGARDV